LNRSSAVEALGPGDLQQSLEPLDVSVVDSTSLRTPVYHRHRSALLDFDELRLVAIFGGLPSSISHDATSTKHAIPDPHRGARRLRRASRCQ
jgi:hypothetical protein